MIDNDTPTEDLRAETAEAAPELAEHDRIADLEAQLAESKAAALYATAEIQIRRGTLNPAICVSRKAQRSSASIARKRKRATHVPMP